MKQIKSIELINFRSYEHAIIDVDLLTSITGANDQGKSNVYRAFDVVLLNEPFTQGALRYGTKEGSVKVVFTDDTWMERTRKGSKNGCFIFDGQKIHDYSTVKDLDQVVAEFTGFKKITLDKNSKDESIQLIPIDAGQNFLISGVNPEGVLRRVNRLMLGSGIETAKIALEKDLRALVAQRTVYGNQVTHSGNVVKALDDPVWAEALVKVDELDGKVTTLGHLEVAITVLADAQVQAQKYQENKRAYRLWEDCDQRFLVLKKVFAEYQELCAAVSSAYELQQAIDTALTSLNTLYDREDAARAEREQLAKELVKLEAAQRKQEIAEAEQRAKEAFAKQGIPVPRATLIEAAQAMTSAATALDMVEDMNANVSDLNRLAKDLQKRCA